jgi:4-carboxymuconolactone decarboxylase
MPRIPLSDIEQQPEPIREFMARHGDLGVFGLLAHAPQVFVGWSQMVDDLFASPTFSQRTKQMIMLRVAHLQNSRSLAGTVGLSEQEIAAITDVGDREAAGLSETERAALDLVTELCTTHRLGDDTFATANQLFGTEALTELLMLVSWSYGLALVENALESDDANPLP